MLIAEFARVTGLSRDTIRFYVRRGLLKPKVGASGTNRYQSFDAEQVERALIVRNAQALGFSLKEISALDAEYQLNGMSLQRQISLMRERMELIDSQIAKLREMRRYFHKKIVWMESGEKGKPPAYLAAARRLSRSGC